MGGGREGFICLRTLVALDSLVAFRRVAMGLPPAAVLRDMIIFCFGLSCLLLLLLLLLLPLLPPPLLLLLLW